MSRRSTGILAVIAIALFAYIVVYERHTLGTAALEGRDRRVAQEYVRAEVDRLTIERPGEPSIELVREREDDDALGTWRMVAPMPTGADDDAVGALLGAVDWADARRRIEGPSAGDLETFGLQDPRVTGTFTMGNERLTLAVGAETPGGEGVYVTADGGDSVVIAGKDLFEAMDHDVDHWRSKRLLERGMLTATELSIRHGDEEVELALDDGRWQTAEGVRAAGLRLDEALQALTDLEARRFLPEGEVPESAFAEPVVVRAVRSAGEDEGEGTLAVELTLGGPCEDETRRYARVRVESGGETEERLACVAERDVEPFLVPPLEWRELRPLTLSDLELESMTVTGPDGTLTLEQEGMGWVYRMGDQTGEVDEEALAEWVRAMKANRAQSIVVPADEAALRSHGLLDPSVVVTLEGTEGRTESVALGSVSSEGTYLRRDDEPAILVASVAAAADFAPSLARLRPRELITTEADAIRELAIRRTTDGTPTTERLERSGEGWRITAPLTMDAAATEARAVARELASLQALRFVADRAAAEHGLGDPRIDLTFTVREGEETRERRLRIGRPTEGGAFARLDETTAVFVLEQDLIDRLEGPLVPRDLLGTSRYEVRSLTFTEGDRTLRIRNDGGQWVSDAGPIPDERVDGVLGTLDHLRVAGTTVYGPPAPADGLTPPRATIHVEREEGGPEPREYDLLIGAPTGIGDTVHVRRGDLPVGFTLREPTVDALLEPLR